ncbi:MAG: ABC transporter ATP-binding protein [Candidatus Izemoplasmatales bacterium]|nr:ABC transporter ATP-binding protein [Candidatus Izemoplasmatales bacterium]NLF49370.1 ABC transporter ATP-binding protein [Acholeplasmataceae bacterium]MDD4355013.1 ABC transporter ATP-binding protein [Candidatus Izemoplasmatales bacterium]MDD4988154.1 ABC transporter ATP-binding protein [Candidatus Izemoplasmatales bacterium]MDD5601751.1 ABC transporter ATP-binding protein [Candidatus Izemoplasmatales bacterium]
MEAAIRVMDISKTFNLSRKQQKIEQTKSKIKVAVDGLSFDAYPNEIYGLLGPNGAGKTTTLRCISTLIKPDKGDIMVQGKSVMRDSDGVRQAIGFLTSDMKLEEFFTPNYLFDYFSKLHGVIDSVASKRKQALFQKFGIDRFQEVKVGELSSGMRQKTQLVISLVHDPDVIIFDEPTNGLDVLTAKVVTDYLIELKNAGKTIIVSTHIFSLVEKICDRVGIILNGKLKATGCLEELIEKGDTLEEYFFRLAREEAGDNQ